MGRELFIPKLWRIIMKLLVISKILEANGFGMKLLGISKILEANGFGSINQILWLTGIIFLIILGVAESSVFADWFI